MEDFKDELPLQRRYEVLKSICKEQILINETLKLELKNLGETLQKVAHERSVLLNELLNNHASCPTSLIDSKSGERQNITLPNTGKRSPSQLVPSAQSKKLKFESSSEVKPTNTSLMVGAQETEFEHSPWSDQDYLDDRSLGTSRQFDPSFSPPLVQTRVSASKHPHLSNSFDPLNEDDGKASYESNISFSSATTKRSLGSIQLPHNSSVGSSGTVTSQRPVKASLLVTNPLVSGNQAAFASILSVGSPPSKHISLPNRIITGSSGLVSSFSRSGPVQIKSSFSLSSGITTASGSGPSTTTLRVASGSAPGQRLLIQPTASGVSRSVCINPSAHSNNYSSG